MKKLIFLISVVLFFAIYSCNRGRQIGEFYLSEEMKSQLPFNGNETIRFIDENDNIFMLSGDGRITTFIEETECISCYDYYVFEKEWINFSDEAYEIRLKLNASEQSYFNITYTIEGELFWCGFTSPLSEENLKDQESFIDSITINNRNYYEVYRDTMRYQGSLSISPYPTFCYYSTEYGVLKIDFSDDSYWELENIEW